MNMAEKFKLLISKFKEYVGTKEVVYLSGLQNIRVCLRIKQKGRKWLNKRAYNLGVKRE